MPKDRGSVAARPHRQVSVVAAGPIAAAVPATEVGQVYAREFARKIFGGRFKGIERLLPLSRRGQERAEAEFFPRGLGRDAGHLFARIGRVH